MLRRLSDRPSFTISKDGDPYLTRWWLSEPSEESYHRRKYRPALLLHRIHLADADRWPHDHPWWFVGLVLKGSYLENRYDSQGVFCGQVERRRFSLAFRRASDLHDIAEVSNDLWTLVLVGPKRRRWGFMTDSGWVRWEEYVY